MYSTISSKIETVQGKRVEACILFAGSLRMRSANLQICHAAASATRVNQGVEPWVLQQPLASPRICQLPRQERDCLADRRRYAHYPG
jgi:hypothetical protein